MTTGTMTTDTVTTKTMTTISQHVFGELVTEYVENTLTLRDFLQQEQELLKLRRHEELELLMSQKYVTLEALETNAVKRGELLAQAGLETTAKSWEALVCHMATPSQMDSWQSAQQALAECRNINEVNGKMITRGQQTIGKLLNILKGQAQSTTLYTESGNTQLRSPNPGGPIVKA